MTMKEQKSVKRGKKNEKRQQKNKGERGEGEAGRRDKYRGGCQCGGLMVGVPRLQAISLCYQAK